ncbi:MAG: ribosome biogenesis GTPase Der [Chlamydiales bacterium]|nr:ribosome biogenesis GTPase Der [Chlamydiales bacterium]
MKQHPTTLPKLAIVGRPNVGKSALFNCICKQRIAIVDEAEGITRDRLYAAADFFGKPFQIIDTGGIDSHSKADYNELIKAQAELAIEEADVLVMVVDSRSGVTVLDKELSDILHRTKKPVCLAVNKLDNPNNDHLMNDFLSLGIRHMVPVSATQARNIAELLEAAFADYVPPEAGTEVPQRAINVAVVGRPNVGKSSLVNYVLQEERCIVSPIPGTTRDSIDVFITYQEQQITLIDTAGVRRKQSEHEVVDKFAAIRTKRAIERSDICILMLDAQQGMTAQDKKIAGMVEEAKKGCILLLNKWDLVKGFRMEHCLQSIYEDMPFLKHCPVICTSAKQGRNIDKIFPEILRVDANCRRRVTTHELNTFVSKAMQVTPPPMMKGKRLRVYYTTQVGIQPPTFVLFINYPDLMMASYKRYLYNQFRDKYGFEGAPVFFYLKGKKKEKRELKVKPIPPAHFHDDFADGDDYEAHDEQDEHENTVYEDGDEDEEFAWDEEDEQV